MSVYTRFYSETIGRDGLPEHISLHYPENFNFGYDVVDAIAEQTPDKRALVWCNTEGEEAIFCFEDVRRISNQYANALQRRGIGRGDRVLVALKRHYEYWFLAVALHKLGAVLTPITHMLTPHDIAYRLNAAPFAAVVCSTQNDLPEKVAEAVKLSDFNGHLFTVKGDADGFENLPRIAEEESTELSRVETAVTEPMLLYFTSGTTGQPKGVIHDFTYPLAHIVTAKYWQEAEDGGLHFTVAETGWAKSSWGKIYGQWLVGSAVMVFDFDNFDPKQLLTVMRRYGVTSFCAPPTIYRYLVRKDFPSLPDLRHASTAGEQLSPDVFNKFKECTGITLKEGYGQTETTLLLGNFKGGTSIPGSLGKPSPFYNIRLQKEDGSDAAPGEIGEVVVVPPEGGKQIGIFTQYLRDDELYRKVWDGGVYHTGDAAFQDEEGNFWFHGRFDDIIKTGGYRVGPWEVENVLATHPAVLECSVIGVPDSFRGQAIKAYILLAPGFTPSKELEKEIREFCNHQLANYKWIRLIEFVTEMPKTVSGKIRKTALRKASAAGESSSS